MKKITRTLGFLLILTLIPPTLQEEPDALAALGRERLDPLGSSPGNSEESLSLTAIIYLAERDGSGEFLSITWGVENSGNDQVSMLWLRDRSYSYSGQNFAGVTVLNTEKGTRHHPVMDGDGSCLCSGSISNDLVQNLYPGGLVTYWSLFSVPEDVETVTVEIPNFDPIEDIPIS